MLFLGDVAVPNDVSFYFDNNISKQGKLAIANLEGLIINEEKENSLSYKVFNSKNTIKYLKQLNVKAVSLANNHVTDVSEAFTYTKRVLKEHDIQFFGAGYTETEASKPIVIKEGIIDYVIVGFGWNVIGCKRITPNKLGVNQIDEANFKRCITELLLKYNGKRVIPFIHWNYELEAYPQPLHRKLAHWAIDKGVYAVVGCHPHCVHDIEIYKNKAIIYSVGNFAFASGYYFNKMLCFPEISRIEYGAEFLDEDIVIHKYEHNRKKNIITEESSYKITESTLKAFDYNDKEYEQWFKKNRRKRKALPVFSNSDPVVNELKCIWINLRQKVIKLLMFLRIKGKPQ